MSESRLGSIRCFYLSATLLSIIIVAFLACLSAMASSSDAKGETITLDMLAEVFNRWEIGYDVERMN